MLNRLILTIDRFVPVLERFIEAPIRRAVSLHLGRRTRAIVRAVAYSCPVVAPLLASIGLFDLCGWVGLTGLASLWVVMLRCGPSKLEQFAFVILSTYYLLLLATPTLVSD